MSKIKCLITAGPTREFFDPVRFISNPSSGKMGLAIAQAAKEAGWDVSLVLGPCALDAPKDVKLTKVISAEDMLKETSKLFPDCDILIMTAAVSDMRPKNRQAQKVKKDSLNMLVEFEPTPDILKTLSQKKEKQILIGFAAETENVLEYAKKKLSEKNLDAIAANSVASENTGFASEYNSISLIFKNDTVFELGKDTKANLAKKFIAKLEDSFFKK